MNKRTLLAHQQKYEQMTKKIAQFETIITGLLENGYGVADDFWNVSDVQDLNTSFTERYDKSEFKAAGISKNAQEAKTIRGDEILWLEKETENIAEQNYLIRIEEFILYLNQTCYLGLRTYELHFASYGIGTFYKRHLDRFKNDSDRKLSIICYLNETWLPENGGELVLYLPTGKKIILPVGGRFICFESDKLEHEVLVANLERRSVTGWLK